MQKIKEVSKILNNERSSIRVDHIIVIALTFSLALISIFLDWH